MNPSDSGTTVLRLEGRDALPLLDRIATQRLVDLAPGEARWTPFCDFRGRLLHRALVAVTADGAVWLMRDDAPGIGLAAAVNTHVFREDVRIGDGGARWAARLVLDEVSGARPEVIEDGGAPVSVRAGDDLRMILTNPAPLAPDPERERRRVRAGRPRHGQEIVQEFHPYEVNLGDEVHLDKGCYTGQEALQRLITYHSVRRRLARAEGPGDAPAVPQAVRAGSDPAGVLTSAVGDGSRWIGLAVLRHEACAPDAPLRIDGGTIDRAEAFEIHHPHGRQRV